MFDSDEACVRSLILLKVDVRPILQFWSAGARIYTHTLYSHYLHALMRHLKPWLVELIWFAATAILVVLVLLPIRQQIYGFPFERANILFIIGFVTLIRWFLFLSSTPFNRTHWVKIILGMGSIWLGIYALRQFSFFQTFIDEKGIESTIIPAGSTNNQWCIF